MRYWKSLSLPYPEPGLRLIRHQDISLFHNRMGLFQFELKQAVQVLDAHYHELREDARRRSG